MTAVGARHPNRLPCPFKPSQSQPVKSLPVSARLIPQSLCPSAQSLSTKTPAVVDRLPCPCPCPPSPSQFLLVNPLAAHKKPTLVARQLPNSLWPSSSSLPVNQHWIRKNAHICPSTHLLPAKFPAVVARQSTLCFCPSIYLLPLPVTSLTASVRQHPLCPSTHSLSAKTPAVVARRPYRCLARPPPHSLCPSTQSLYLPVESLTVSARRLTHSLCPSAHSQSLPVDPITAGQNFRCICPSNHSQSLPVLPLAVHSKLPVN
ncbi:hypothetical protein OUZ56_026506 [Daphnia magna]|uniref:Uncharacterized protein n=1 Tax=Daphnia magna TaxID=35525 RepID=A0ABQ9ZMC5_9CRUS|nr:hypothetical protein OUZ56_026506 [Daphnia magna]